MSGKTVDLVVGLVFFGAMALLGYTTIFKAQSFKQKKYYRVRFPKVYGLKEGSRVRCEGKNVGEVTRLELIDRYVRATLEVDADVAVYSTDHKISVTPFSPLGGRIVEITRGQPGTGELSFAPNAKEAASVKVHDGDAEGELLSALTALINDNRPKIDAIVDNIKNATDRLGEDSNLIGKVLTDKTFANKFDKMAGHLSNASSSIEVVAARIEKGDGVIGELTVDESKLHKDVRGTVENAKDALDEFRKVGKSMNEGDGLINVVLNDREFAEHWKGTSRNIDSITGKVAAGHGIMRLFSEDEVYEDLRDLTKHGKDIAQKVNEGKGPLAVLVSDDEAGEDLKSILSDVAGTAKDLNEGKGPLGALINDEELRERTNEIFTDAARVIREFRDSIEDAREQAPVSAFVGTAFSAF